MVVPAIDGASPTEACVAAIICPFATAQFPVPATMAPAAKPALVPKLRFPEFRNKAKWRVKKLNEEMEKSGGLHYTVKYNPFMGVRSDWKDDSISS